MLSLLRELKAGVLFEYSPEFLKHHSEATTLVQKGDDALSAMAVELEWWVDLDSATLVEDLTAAYEEHVFVYAENGLGPYFRVLHTMLRTIDDADYLKPSDKIEYGNLLRSQLTSNELLLAGINGMVPASRRFQAFLTHYRMLKYLRPTPLRAVLQSSYPPEAFLGRDHAGRDLVARRKNVEPPAPSSSP